MAKEVIEKITCDMCKEEMKSSTNFTLSKTIGTSLGDAIVAYLEFSIIYPGGYVADVCDNCCKKHIKKMAEEL